MIKKVTDMLYIKMAHIIRHRVMEFFQLHIIGATMAGIENTHIIILLKNDV
jgi:hypothetical protein